MLYPSWPSLVFLLWSCGIWLVPRVNPRKSVFYSSPLLVTYSFILLLIQYAYSLHLFVDEFNKNNDVVPECHFGRREGCKSIALLAKVRYCSSIDSCASLIIRACTCTCVYSVGGSVFCSVYMPWG